VDDVAGRALGRLAVEVDTLPPRSDLTGFFARSGRPV